MTTETKQQNRTAGFTLIEIAIAMMIVGILLVPTLQLYNLYQKDKARIDTENAIEIVQSALSKYVTQFGRYPAPADPSIAIGAAGSGQEVATPIATACVTDIASPCVTNAGSVDTLADVDVLSDNVYIGDVPYATLGIPYLAALDARGFKLKYAVTANLTSDATFNNAWGAIELLNDERNTTLPASGSNYLAGAPRAHFVILSHGQDSRGAFNQSGTITQACGTAANGLDFENCDNDAVFKNNIYQYKVIVADPDPDNSPQYSYAVGANYFDDVVYAVTSVLSGIWSFIPNESSITSTQGGNVQVGPVAACTNASCLPVAKLNVNGDVRADGEIRTGRVCGALTPSTATTAHPSIDCNIGARTASAPWNLPANWFVPSIFGGTPDNSGLLNANLGHNGGGILCGEDAVNDTGFRGLAAIRNFEEICLGTVSIGNPAQLGPTCPIGTFGVGLTAAGALICE
ncbi:MAG: type II secretion system GspH family protein [Alphaproteobacteria bacterium]|nr:type II secretion system GspH family protein [Alphaproteobacteria bacterium]